MEYKVDQMSRGDREQLYDDENALASKAADRIQKKLKGAIVSGVARDTKRDGKLVFKYRLVLSELTREQFVLVGQALEAAE